LKYIAFLHLNHSKLAYGSHMFNIKKYWAPLSMDKEPKVGLSFD